MIKNKSKIESLQVFRGLAALGVVLFHCQILKMGWLGVDFFFCLSGFIIMLVHQKDIGHPERLKSFALKRWIRTYPTLFVVLAGWCAYHIYKGISKNDWYSDELFQTSMLWGIAKTALMLPGFARAVASSWTLPHEYLFYALFALAIIIKEKKVVWGIFLTWMAGILIYTLRTHPVRDESISAFLFTPYKLEFLGGVLVAWLCQLKGDRKMHLAAFVGWIALTVVSMAIKPTLFRACAWGGGFCILIWMAVQIERQTGIQMPYPLVLMGDASYAIYLIGFPVLGVTKTTGWIGAAVTVFIGILFYLIIEKPMLRFLNKKLLNRV